MGAPSKDIQAGEQAVASEALFSAFKTIDAAERNRHCAVYDYWLAIRGEREFPSIRDLDPLQISDAGPCSILLELIGGGENAEIRHVGDTLKGEVDVERIIDAPRASLLSCIASKLAIVAISRDALAFEDEFKAASGKASCRVTLLPFSSTGPWVDFVYGFVTIESASQEVADELEAVEAEEAAPPAANDVEEVAEPLAELEPVAESPPEPVDEPAPAADEAPATSPKGFDPSAGVEGFFGNVVNLELDTAEAEIEQPAPEPVAEQQPAADIEPEQITSESQESENSMQHRLEEVRAKADEARIAKQQSVAALQQGLSAAYDFALDAEDSAEDYLKLVEAKGVKIQLRSPMAPVVRLAFDGLCDEATIAELEGVMAWALKMNLPRGSLAERIEAEGGIAAILNGHSAA